ncbi:MAG: single-stranded-DNA-specific exonuclease RecJ [Deltaproteobacteria bacterium]|nr:single-stranded-DNA-specific exonuclease RecJ [Deltaproteobacteria bacterium]
MGTDWSLACPQPEQAATLAAALGVSSITAQVLIHRGIADPATAERFLHPRLSDLHDPFLLPDMERATDRIIRALATNERITVFGDYDVDGTAATALLLRFFRAIGHDIEFYIPDRNTEGYGLSVTAVNQLADLGTTLILTVDNGTTAHVALEQARARGVDVIVTDHHEPGEAHSTAAFAVINPKRANSQYPESVLCGAGVAFKLLTALRARLRDAPQLMNGPEPNLKQFLDLVAVATIADIVPLTGENRILCRFGFDQLKTHAGCGLHALMRQAGMLPSEVDTYRIAFGLAPRLNAAGRLAHARLAVELLATEDAARAATLAAELDRLNAERQAIEARILAECEARLAADPDLASRPCLVLADAAWPVGVIGIIAGRLAERYRVPTVLIGLGGDIARGSARSIGEFPLLDALLETRDTLLTCGGHRAAAGLTLRPDQWTAFAKRFAGVAARHLLPTHRQRRITIDAQLDAAAITPTLTKELAQLHPFGPGNPEPLFTLHGTSVVQRRIVGKNHLRLRLAGAHSPLDAIGFSMGEHSHGNGASLDVAFHLEFNTFQGRTSLQLRLRDLRPAGDRGS